MHSAPPSNNIEHAAKTYSHLRTVAVAIISVVGAIFAAGVYYSELRHKLDEYVNRIEALEKNYAKVDVLTNDLAVEKKTIRASVNDGFARLRKIENAERPAFKNAEPKNNGGGNDPTFPPGRCHAGEVVVGIQPHKETNGVRSIVMQCGAVPQVHVE